MPYGKGESNRARTFECAATQLARQGLMFSDQVVQVVCLSIFGTAHVNSTSCSGSAVLYVCRLQSRHVFQLSESASSASHLRRSRSLCPRPCSSRRSGIFQPNTKHISSMPRLQGLGSQVPRLQSYDLHRMQDRVLLSLWNGLWDFGRRYRNTCRPMRGFGPRTYSLRPTFFDRSYSSLPQSWTRSY